MKHIFFWLFISCLVPQLSTTAKACTSIIVTGKHTADGRPLMWKHRDTSQPTNHIAYLHGERYNFIGLMNSNLDGEIWIGTNTAGFSIMNTASYNLKDDQVTDMDKEGRLMRRALEICRTTADFEQFLDTLTRPMRVEANFGVIDAHGGAAYYETNNTHFYKRDANDPQLAPQGYLLCTNFSFNGRKDEGYGYIRYTSAEKIISRWKASDFTPDKLFWDGSNSFFNAQTGINLYNEQQLPAIAPNGWVVEQDFIARKESTASVVIQGVKPGENPEMVTFWAALGYPPLAVAIPLWAHLGDQLPKMVSYNDTLHTAPLCHYATTLKDAAYSIHRGSGPKYLHWSLLWNTGGTGWMQQIKPVWYQVYNSFQTQLPHWRRHGLDAKQIQNLYLTTDSKLTSLYRSLIPNSATKEK